MNRSDLVLCVYGAVKKNGGSATVLEVANMRTIQKLREICFILGNTICVGLLKSYGQRVGLARALIGSGCF